MNNYTFKNPIPESQITITQKAMSYKVASVKKSNMWITDYHDGMDIKDFRAFKSVPFKLNISNETFRITHRLITNETFIKYTTMLNDKLVNKEIEMPKTNHIGDD